MRSFIAPIVAVVLTASSALADNSPLPAGKPAGVKQAELAGDSLFFLIGAAAIAAGIAIAVSNNHGNQPTTSTSGTSP